MKKREIIKLSFFIICLCYCCFKYGQGNPEVITTEVIREVETNDKGFCVSCYKKHSYDQMYVLMSDYTE